jgi:hypothetical protein
MGPKMNYKICRFVSIRADGAFELVVAKRYDGLFHVIIEHSLNISLSPDDRKVQLIYEIDRIKEFSKNHDKFIYYKTID